MLEGPRGLAKRPISVRCKLIPAVGEHLRHVDEPLSAAFFGNRAVDTLCQGADRVRKWFTDGRTNAIECPPCFLDDGEKQFFADAPFSRSFIGAEGRGRPARAPSKCH